MRHFSILLLACVLTTTNAIGANAPQTVAVWERWEGRLAPANEGKLVPADTKVDILYQGPQREEIRVPAVRDERNSLLFRMAFPAPGRWRWVAKSDHPDFDGQTGEVLVTASTSRNPFYRCGDVRVSENRRYLTHADGTPFLWMGDTCWSVPWKATLGSRPSQSSTSKGCMTAWEMTTGQAGASKTSANAAGCHGSLGRAVIRTAPAIFLPRCRPARVGSGGLIKMRSLTTIGARLSIGPAPRR
jgi:hypothetical protein